MWFEEKEEGMIQVAFFDFSLLTLSVARPRRVGFAELS